jgi:hypothetical protein
MPCTKVELNAYSITSRELHQRWISIALRTVRPIVIKRTIS